MTVLMAGTAGKSGAAATLGIAGVRQQFQEQIDFFKGKLNLPSERWSDVWQSAHDRAFMVAGAQKADLLNDLRLAVDKSIQGAGIEAFRKDFWAAVDRSGWTGWTGQGTAAGEAWRTRVIYQTNMATSYAAGRWQQLNDPDLLKVRPYWKYIHSDSAKHPRLMHKAWGDSGLTLRHDDPFWATHFPPNGWGCLCRVTAVRAPGPGDATSPPDGWDAIDPKTGAPVGIDKGWDYAPGAKVGQSFQRLIDDKLIQLKAPIGAALWEMLQPVLAGERLAAWQAVFDTTLASKRPLGNAVLVHVIDGETVRGLADAGIDLVNASVWIRDNDLQHAVRDTKTSRDAILPNTVWRNLPERLDSAVPYLDTVNKTLVYAFDLGRKLGKVAIHVNYNEKGRFEGVRQRIVSNFLTTGGVVEPKNITAGTQYRLLKKM
jgi:Phage Mu protein F like protein